MITADTITDEQIRALRREKDRGLWWAREFAIALGEVTTANRPQRDYEEARARCAELLNARAKEQR